jgi:hypothetical protein
MPEFGNASPHGAWGRGRLAAIAALMVVAAALTILVGSSRATSGARCLHGRSFVSCRSLVVTPDHPARPVPAPTAFWPSGQVVGCGRAFFSRSQLTELESQFGMISCFRFGGSGSWLVTGAGIQMSGADRPPGGAMVATENCGQDASCLNPSTPHQFSAFTVSRFPVPSAWMRLQTTYGNRLLLLGGGCRLYLFDTDTLHWYEGLARDVNAILGGAGEAQRVTAFDAISGSTALSRVAPSGLKGCK